MGVQTATETEEYKPQMGRKVSAWAELLKLTCPPRETGSMIRIVSVGILARAMKRGFESRFPRNNSEKEPRASL